MSKPSILVLVASLAMIFGATSAFAANSLTVNTAAAIVGTYGLEVLVDGSSNAAYVADTTPADELVYRASFRIAHNNISMDDGNVHAIFMGRMGGGAGNVLRLFTKRIGSNYKIRCRFKRDAVAGGGTGFCGQFNFAPINTFLTVEWAAATGPGTNDGTIKLTKGTTVQFNKTNAPTSDFEIDTARLGLPQGVPATSSTTSGSFYLDDFSSFRTLAP